MRSILLITIFLLIFIDAAGVAMVAPLLSDALFHKPVMLLENFSLPARSIYYGIALGIYSFFMLIAAPILGELSDRYGRRSILLVCLFGLTLSYLLLAIAISSGSATLMLIGRSVAGITAASQAVAQASALDMTNANRKSFIISMCLLTSSLGFVLGPVLAGVFSNTHWVSWFDADIPFYIVSIFSAILLVSIYLFYRDTKTISQRKGKIKLFESIRVFSDAFTIKRIINIVMIFALMQMAWGAYFLFLPAFLYWKFNLTTFTISLYLSMLGIGFCLSYGIVIPILLKYLSNTVLAKIGLFATAIFLLINVLLPYGLILWASALLLSVFVCIAYSAMVNLFLASVSEARQCWVLGIVLSVVSFSWGIAPVISGVLNNINFLAPMFFAIILMFSSAIIMLLILRGKHEAAKS